MTEVVKNSKIKEMLNELASQEYGQSVNMSGDFPEELEKELETLLAKTVRRSLENGRKTVQAKDL